jgi:hypothetical protein
MFDDTPIGANPGITQALQGLAQSITASRVRVRISTEITTAAYDPKSHAILISPELPSRIAPGLIVHECLHDRHTDNKAFDTLSDTYGHSYVNMVEDQRMNLNCAPRDMLNGVDWINDVFAYFESLGANGALPSNHVHRQMHGVAPDAPDEWQAEIDVWMAAHADTVRHTAVCTADLEDAIRDLREMDKRLAPDAQKKRDEADEAAKAAQSAASAAARASATKADRAKAKAADEAAKAAAKAGNDVHQGQARMKPAAGDGKSKGIMSAQCGQLSSGGLRVENVDPATTRAAIDELKAWRNRIADALMARTHDGRTPNQKRGLLDMRRLVAMRAGSDAVFSQRTAQRRSVDTAIDFIIDASGSTSNGIEMRGDTYPCCSVCMAAGFALAEAVSRVPGIQYGVLQYSDEARRLLPIRSARGVQAQTFIDACGHDGGTETNATVARSVNELRAVKADRRISIVVTDAAPLDLGLHAIYKAMGVEVYSLCVIDDRADDPEHGIYRRHREADLPSMLDKLVHAMRLETR